MSVEIIHGDCLEYMAGLADGAFDLAIVDPPYGLGEGQKKANQRCRSTTKWKSARPPKYGGGEWDSAQPDDSYFKEINRVSKNQIIWGANHFGNMKPSSGWIVWFKKRFDEVNDFSDAELAYSSFNRGCRIFHLPWIGFGAVNAGENRIHPTQKPVALYRWLLHNYAKPGWRILDTHLGSGSSAIAAHEMGFDFVGIEIDEEYVTAARKRFDLMTRQMALDL